ncbi:EpsG family protein [Vibrio parahaemolyticus]|uniref:EpsG family protein n=1 Tax=Vibrio parahaemolyticus TaxID=670 RepID=UPI00084B90A9|nr:EpsG family protein [Vibrio parahaemolyticus]EHU5190399.1 EpsG family protein [Vibrio parahaemolyticus]EJG1504251.1 EpsG family protein [Vibrio parahaemolyticus]MCS0067378.1 EpsG family protein [Vibrio parahaemolyticus]MCS0259716.1 EpsG family protein [Vibrio parahaemolyticus]ODY50429.1 hypothetical protein BBM96_19885 [Vibrio parahaemolyticus]
MLSVYIIALVDLNNCSKSLRSFFSIIIGIYFSILIGFSFQLGVDWLFYFELYNGASNSLLFIEPLYLFINDLFSLLNFNYVAYSFIIVFAFYFSLIRFFGKRSKKVTICIALSFSLMLFFTVEAKRQVIAMIIFISISVRFLEKERLFLYYISVLLAALVHVSAIFLILVPTLTKYNPCSKKQNFLIVIFLLLSMYKLDLIAVVNDVFLKSISNEIYEKIEYYIFVAKENDNVAFNINNLIKTAVFASMVVFYCKIEAYAKNEKLLQTLPAMKGCVLAYFFVSVFFSGFGVFSDRLSVYFLPHYVLLISWIIAMSGSMSTRFAILLATLIVFFTSFYRSTSNDYFSIHYSNYEGILMGDKLDDPMRLNERTSDVRNHFINKSLK